MLPEGDRLALENLGMGHRVAIEDGFITIMIDRFPMPSGLQPPSSALLLRLPPGFPDAAPDMFWFDPVVRGSGGRVILGTEATQEFLGRSWQRWSRHIQGQWRPGIDNLSTYLAYVQRCLQQAGEQAA